MMAEVWPLVQNRITCVASCFMLRAAMNTSHTIRPGLVLRKQAR